VSPPTSILMQCHGRKSLYGTQTPSRFSSSAAMTKATINAIKKLFSKYIITTPLNFHHVQTNYCLIKLIQWTYTTIEMLTQTCFNPHHRSIWAVTSEMQKNASVVRPHHRHRLLNHIFDEEFIANTFSNLFLWTRFSDEMSSQYWKWKWLFAFLSVHIIINILRSKGNISLGTISHVVTYTWC